MVSSMDVIAGVTFIVGPWLVPPSAGYPMAKGNEVSCTVSGVLATSMGMSPCIACCYLSLYFLITTKYSWRERDVQRYLEVPAYALGSVLVVGFVCH